MSDQRVLFAIERRERILDDLRTRGSVTVRAIAESLGVAEITIRRDINALADRGLVTRVHGGATLRSSLDRTVALEAESAQPQYRIGMVLPTLSYYWPEIINGARAAATSANAQIVLRSASYEPRDQQRQLMALIESGTLHGLIAAPETTGKDGAAILEWLDGLDIPVVLAERRVPTALALRHLEWVCTDHEFGAILAVHHLYNEGHQRIGLALPPTSPTSNRLRDGWLRAGEELGLETPPELEHVLEIAANSDLDRNLADLVDRCEKTGTTALIVHSDPQALHLEHYCIDHGVRIPEDLAIVAYDDEIAASGEPPITALRPPKSDVGRVAVETMVERLENGPSRPVRRTDLLPELVVRASSLTNRS
ncbi:substrate-binding domain-containing protein [Microbacterium sp. PMB16]|uniref:LacI family DNA-binding transcriptional regulator n=1 Tax=Microbacterium sp. PMB16 TaxID=3120157 RepID=UPI003F4BD46A